MSFVLQSKGIAPTGAVVDPIPLTEKQLVAQRKLLEKELLEKKKAASDKTS
jgi:hypothetical protein